MKKEIKSLLAQEKWREVNQYVGEHSEEFTEDDLRELEMIYRSKVGSKELDEDELAKVSGGTAYMAGNNAASVGGITGNINYHCNDVSVKNNCHDSVSITSSCWFNDGCCFVFYIYNEEGWVGGIYNDLDKY